MPTTNTNFTSLITAIDTKAQSLAASTTDPKDLVFLGKTVEALNVADTVSAVISEGDTQIAAVQAEGTTQVAAVAAQGANYAPLAGATFTGAVTIPDLTVTGTTTTINSTNLNVSDANITIADGAADSAAADGAGITIDGAGVNFQYSDSGKHMSLNTGLAVEEIKEKVSVSSQTSGTATVFATDQGVLFYNVDQLANRTINITGGSGITLDSILDAGQSYTVSVLMSQGTTAYYLDAYQVDGSAVTPKWMGGDAPTSGNPSSIDIYTFTVIKTAANTFTVLASQSQYS
jgi:hypothetical protein